MIHKEIIDKCGFFDLDFKVVQDTDYWTRIMFGGYKFLSLPDKLVKMRIHSGQSTNLLMDKFEPEFKMFAERVVGYYKDNPENNRKIVITFACKQAKENRPKLKRIVTDAVKPNFAESMKIAYYTVYGKFYSAAKKLYHSIVIKKHRA